MDLLISSLLFQHERAIVICVLNSRKKYAKAFLQIANGNVRFVADQPVSCATIVLIASLGTLLSHLMIIAILHT